MTLLIEKARSVKADLKRRIDNQEGVIGYGIAWLLGVPVTVLILFWLLFDR